MLEQLAEGRHTCSLSQALPGGRIEQPAHAQPVRQPRRPTGERLVGLRQTHAMGTPFVDVQFRRHTRLAQRLNRTSRCSPPEPPSVVVWNKKVGGVCAVTCVSFDRFSTSLGSGFSPIRLRLRTLVRIAGERNHRVAEHQKVRTAAQPVDRVGGTRIARSKCVPAVDARCPPAENPMIPIRSGSRRYSAALERTVRMARCASPSSTGW